MMKIFLVTGLIEPVMISRRSLWTWGGDMVWLAIGLFAALGAWLRHAALQWIPGDGFPLGLLVVNVVGSFLAGWLFEAGAHLTPTLRAALLVGFLGALTTFSGFSVEVVRLVERGAWTVAGLHMVANNALTIGACFLGLLCKRTIFN